MGHEASFTPFELEEWQSRYETTVKYNLADSGCHPVRLSELVSDPAAVEKLLSLDLHYPPVCPAKLCSHLKAPPQYCLLDCLLMVGLQLLPCALLPRTGRCLTVCLLEEAPAHAGLLAVCKPCSFSTSNQVSGSMHARKCVLKLDAACTGKTLLNSISP